MKSRCWTSALDTGMISPSGVWPAGGFERPMELRVKRAPQIDTEITVPGDKSISHRAAIIAALSNGICRLNGFLMGDDCLRTVNALRALGIRIDEPELD